jgi:hypothetical protein
MNDIIFNYYPANIKIIQPLGWVSLAQFINSVKNPKPETKEIFEQIKLAHERQDQAEKQRLKAKLYYFTPCVQIKESRKYDNITAYTGLLCLDFDKLEEDYSNEFKYALFNEYKFIVACWLSASKRGVRAFVKIPICKTVDEFKEYFMALEYDLGIYNGFDSAPKNCVLPLFMSYDQDILYRDDYTTWTKKYIPAEKPKREYLSFNNSSEDELTRRVIHCITKAIDKINDNGHPQLRAAAYALGGYVGADYISRSDAESLINNLIERNNYLSQKDDIYKKTALTMINKGIETPLEFEDESKI